MASNVRTVAHGRKQAQQFDTNHPPASAAGKGAAPVSPLAVPFPKIPPIAGVVMASARAGFYKHDRDDLLRAARAQWKADPALREEYRQFRPNVERVISQIASRGGRRLNSATAVTPRTTPGSNAAPPR